MAQTTGLENNPDIVDFTSMLRIRLVEEAIADRYAEQEMRCPVHLSIGQEASAVGVCAPLTTRTVCTAPIAVTRIIWPRAAG